MHLFTVIRLALPRKSRQIIGGDCIFEWKRENDRMREATDTLPNYAGIYGLDPRPGQYASRNLITPVLPAFFGCWFGASFLPR